MDYLFAICTLYIIPIICVFSSSVRCQSSFPLHAIYGTNTTFASISQSDCISKCPTSSTPVGSSRVIAVSYSSYYQQCMVTNCINVRLRMNALWDTIICPNNNYSPTCNALPTPMYDWMLTDTCGFTNTGWLDTGLLMKPVKYDAQLVLSPSTYSFIRTPSIYGDGAYLNPGLQDGRYMLMAQLGQQVFDPAKGFTIFSYVWFNKTDSSNVYAVFATGWTTGLGQAFTYQSDNWFKGPTESFVYLNTNLRFKYASFFQPYTWHYIATIYDPVAKSLTVTVDGTQFYASTLTAFTTPISINSMFIGSNPNAATPPGGASYCFKMYRATLTAQEITALAASCLAINFNVISS